MKCRTKYIPIALITVALHSIFLSAQITIAQFDPIVNLNATLDAAKKGDVRAQYSLACSYYLGHSYQQPSLPAWVKSIPVDQDIVKSMEWFDRAVAQKYVQAMTAQGSIYLLTDIHRTDLTHNFTIKDLITSVDFLLLTGNYVDPVANKKSFDKGKALLEKAVNLNYAPASMIIADMYMDDFVMNFDYKKVLNYYEMKAGQGDVDSMLILADTYAIGFSYTVNTTIPFPGGCGRAWDNCGNIGTELDTSTVGKNKKKSDMWYKKAADAGNQDAIDHLAGKPTQSHAIYHSMSDINR